MKTPPLASTETIARKTIVPKAIAPLTVAPTISNATFKHARQAGFMRGAIRFWCFDLGCISFLSCALLGLIILVPAVMVENYELVTIALGLIQVSVAVSVAWQLNRLAATEWAVLVPDYRRNIQLQSGALLLATFLCGLLLVISLGIEGQLEYLLLITLIGLSFIYLCQIKNSAFNSSIVVYLAAAVIPVNAWPDFSLLALILANLIMTWRLMAKVNASGWNIDARSAYLNGSEMGWFGLPNIKLHPYLAKMERFLHPANFFIGPMLTLILLLLPLVTLILAGVSNVFELEIPVLFLLLQFSCITCMLVNWSRIQRWRAVELLYVLPGFSGKRGMIAAFMTAQIKLLLVLTGIQALVTGVIALFSPEISFFVWLHLVLNMFAGGGLILGLGSASKRAWQISATLVIILLQMTLLERILDKLALGEHGWLVIGCDLFLVGLALLTLWFGSKKLWSSELV